MNSVAINENSVVTKIAQITTQVNWDKCFYVATKFSTSSQLKKELLSQQRKSCRDITVRIHNLEEQNLCRDKDYFCHDKQNIKEVNSLSRQEAEEQHKKNGDEEIVVAT